MALPMLKEVGVGEGKIEMLGSARCGESQQGYRDPVLGLGFPSLWWAQDRSCPWHRATPWACTAPWPSTVAPLGHMLKELVERQDREDREWEEGEEGKEEQKGEEKEAEKEEMGKERMRRRREKSQGVEGRG